MGPTRSGSSSVPRNKPKASKLKDNGVPSNPSSPGVQKIKSSLRQTRRLLAKDNLAADIRIETERRLKSLESDLTKAERTRKERNMAVKYHKIKFFERQKVCRKIKQAKKELDDPEVSPENNAPLRESLLSHRVDLNYVLHYPKNRKYISLFPPQSSNATDVVGSTDTDRQREELRRWVKGGMEKGEMDAEPEATMDKSGPQDEAMDWAEESQSRPKKEEQKEVTTSRPKGVPGDAFFETFDGDEREQSDGGG